MDNNFFPTIYIPKKGTTRSLGIEVETLTNRYVFTEDELMEIKDERERVDNLIKAAREYLTHSDSNVRETHWEDALQGAIRGIENTRLFKKLDKLKSKQ